MQTKQDNNMNTNLNFKTIALIEEYSCGDSSRYVETFFAGRHGRYRIIVETRNGFPIGYNYNCHLQAWMHPKGWVELTDNLNAGIPYENCYVSNPDRKKEMTEKAVAGFKDYLRNWLDE